MPISIDVPQLQIKFSNGVFNLRFPNSFPGQVLKDQWIVSHYESALFPRHNTNVGVLYVQLQFSYFNRYLGTIPRIRVRVLDAFQS